ncbi:hypothetical protein ACLOJK_038813 [Asimina triloba]
MLMGVPQNLRQDEISTHVRDMEDRVKRILKIMEGDADSFARRAEMYYRQRPELINFVEESYKAYRALADRYDHLSRELHKANNTIASVCPDQVQFMGEDGDDVDDVDDRDYKDYRDNKHRRGCGDVRHGGGNRHDRDDRDDDQDDEQEQKQEEEQEQEQEQEQDKEKEKQKEREKEKEKEKEREKEKEKEEKEKEKEKEREKEKEKEEKEKKKAIEIEIEKEKEKMKEKEQELECQREQKQKQQEEEQQEEEEEEKEEPPSKPPSPDPDEILKPAAEKPDFDLKPSSPRKDSKCPLPPRTPLPSRNPLPPRSPLQKSPKKPQRKKTVSQQSKAEAQGKIDKLQKGILVLQTEKEFVKSSYETGLSKYWDIENAITQMQEEVCSLQEEFSVDAEDTVIEDNEARALMTSMALKSCKDTLVHLREQKKKLVGDVRQESKRVKDAKDRLNALKDGSRKHRTNNGRPPDSTVENLEGDGGVLKQEGLELQTICEKIREYFDVHSNSASTVTELAEKVDELVTMVLGLETKVSSQTAYMETLKSKNQELENQVKSLEEEKKSSKSKEWNTKVGEVEKELQGAQDLNQSVEDGNNALQTAFMDACLSFGSLLQKIQAPKQAEEEEASSSEIEMGDSPGSGSHDEPIPNFLRKNSTEIKREAEIGRVEEDSPDWQQLFSNGLEDREKVLLTEYTATLRNYKETKRKLSEMETRTQETLARVTELTSSNATKDQEIRSLRQKLGFTHPSLEGDSNTLTLESNDSDAERSKSVGSNEKSTYDKSYKILEELLYDKKRPPSTVEEKFRRDIDQLVEENLQSLLRFSTSTQKIHKFQPKVQELHADFFRVRKNTKKQEGGNHASENSSVESAPLNKRLKELRTELFLWSEQNELLKEELQRRVVSLHKIEEDLSRVLESCFASELTPYQAAKFQGEIRNMRNETKKIADELQEGLDHVKKLQVELERLPKTTTVAAIAAAAAAAAAVGDVGPSGAKQSQNRYQQVRHSTGKTKIPLRSFIFGVKAKKNLTSSSGEAEAHHDSQKGDSTHSTKESGKGDSTHSRKGDSTHSRKGDSTHSRKGDSTHSTREKGDSTHSTKESRKGDSTHSTKEQ